MKARPLWMTLGLLAATMALGIAVRFALPGPWWLKKYGGSALWAMAIYWLVCVAMPRVRLARAAVAAGILATAVEFFKLYRSPAVDAFRGTVAGMLTLGRYFSVQDVAVYWLAICAAAWLDRRLRRKLP